MPSPEHRSPQQRPIPTPRRARRAPTVVAVCVLSLVLSETATAQLVHAEGCTTVFEAQCRGSKLVSCNGAGGPVTEIGFCNGCRVPNAPWVPVEIGTELCSGGNTIVCFGGGGTGAANNGAWVLKHQGCVGLGYKILSALLGPGNLESGKPTCPVLSSRERIFYDGGSNQRKCRDGQTWSCVRDDNGDALWQMDRATDGRPVPCQSPCTDQVGVEHSEGTSVCFGLSGHRGSIEKTCEGPHWVESARACDDAPCNAHRIHFRVDEIQDNQLPEDDWQPHGHRTCSRSGVVHVCANGTWEKTDESCKTCPAGRVCAFSAGTTYKATDDFTPPGPCPTGMYCEKGKPVGTCPRGSTCKDGVRRDCPANKYCDGSNAAPQDCSALGNSEYCEGGLRRPCPWGSTCKNGDRDKCPIGQYCSDGEVAGICTSLEPTHYCHHGRRVRCPDGALCTKGGRYACPSGDYCSRGVSKGACSGLPGTAYCVGSVKAPCPEDSTCGEGRMRTTWIGTAPFCGGSPKDCRAFGMRFVESHKKNCATGRKVKCTSEAAPTTSVWIGKPPFCGGEPKDCRLRSLTYVRSTKRKCMTGKRVLCMNVVGRYEVSHPSIERGSEANLRASGVLAWVGDGNKDGRWKMTRRGKLEVVLDEGTFVLRPTKEGYSGDSLVLERK